MFSIPKPSETNNEPQSLQFSFFDYVYSLASPSNRKTTIILLYTVIALSVWKYIPSSEHFIDPSTGTCLLSSFTSVDTITSEVKPLDGKHSSHISFLQFLWNSRKIWAAFFIMGVFPVVIVKFCFKENLADYGLGKGLFKRTLKNTCIFLPIMLVLGWISGFDKAFYTVYPFNPLAGISWPALIIHSTMYLFLYYLAWEFMFRGFLQLGLASQIGSVPAILLQVLASTMLHYGHPASETFGCIAGGLLWGFLVYRTKSIYSGWIQHALLGISLDWSLVLNSI